jgi:hypothetical protein
MLMSRVLRESLTGPDDVTYELVELIGGFGFIVGVLLQIVDLSLQWWTGRQSNFNFAVYMGGLATGVVAIGGSQRIRDGKTQ